jgi:hypothetical protein
VRWRRGRRLHVEAHAVDDRAGEHGVVSPHDHHRRCIAHHRRAVEVAVAVVP